MEKTEEGKTDAEETKTGEAATAPADQTLDSAMADETLQSEQDEMVTEEVTAVPDNANNNRDRNANASLAQRGRRCCLCVCCPPDTDEPTLEELWRVKRARLKGNNARAYRQPPLPVRVPLITRPPSSLLSSPLCLLSSPLISPLSSSVLSVFFFPLITRLSSSLRQSSMSDL